MIPATNEIFYFVRESRTQRVNKTETMALAFLEQTDEGKLRFRRIDWTQLTIAVNRFINPEYMLSLSVIGGENCVGVETAQSMEDLHTGVFEFHASKYTPVDKPAFDSKRKYIIDKALALGTEADQQKAQEAAA